ncbi:unknown [Bacteroides sp. CAG:545]|nr:unknown [Bacteroides sp. CAG:545]
MSVKDKVLIDIGDYQLFELDVLFDMSLTKVVQQEFL